ncbi:MAG: hypothetical protein ABIG71_02215, partial [Candidatus Uhrbacteria bacterium]
AAIAVGIVQERQPQRVAQAFHGLFSCTPPLIGITTDENGQRTIGLSGTVGRAATLLPSIPEQHMTQLRELVSMSSRAWPQHLRSIFAGFFSRANPVPTVQRIAAE